MNIRQNIYTLTDDQLDDLKVALDGIKTNGAYDQFIVHHHHAMMTATLMPGESGGANVRNAAHRGPAFLPWHRYFCREFELALQTIKPNVTLPYWDWAADATDPAGAALWNTDPAQPIYVGGDGTGPGGVVNTGPFASWTALVEDSAGNLVPRTGGLIRDLGGYTLGDPDFPTAAQVDDAVQNMTVYDTSPWRTASTGSFRNRLEGWVQNPGESGSQLHNRVHLWVGGDMGPGTSPNDPVFFLHHCNVDRLWAQWQHAHPASGYLPASGGPPGHNLNDAMLHLTTPAATPADSLDYRRTMGFIYDTDPPLVELPSPTVNFQDVPTLETTWRAAVFHVRAGSTIQLEVVAGSGPSAPYTTTPIGTSVIHVPPVDNAPFDEVRVWFAFTGASVPGSAPDGSVQIRCVETNEIFNVTLKANTVPRPTTGVVFSLDKSGSMSLLAGTGGTRMQLLHEAAARCIELIRDGSGAGMVSFDHDAYPGQPLQAFQSSTTHRADVLAAVNALSPGGATSIGDGVELARSTLIAGAAGFDGQAIVVMTDGLENQPKPLSAVAGSIDDRTFAIGLGTAQQVSTAALSSIANGTGGYLLMTGPLTASTDSYFLLSKYFQQILVSATNENIVVDPSGLVGSGDSVRIPFELAEADIDATVVLFVDLPVVELQLETPTGDRLAESDLTALGAQLTHGTGMTYCRFGLPLPVGSGAHRGKWHVLLSVRGARLKRELDRLASEQEGQGRNLDFERARAHGARYCVTVSSWSNARMNARLTQSSFEPGARLRLDAALTEYGLPLARPARVEASLTRPDGMTIAVPLREEAPGVYAGEMVAGQEGVWQGSIRARGHTRYGSPFNREQRVSAAVITGGDRPWPEQSSAGDSSLTCLVRCLAGDRGWQRWLEERGLDARRLEKCLAACRGGQDAEELDRLG